jgi:hypothetical protein
MLRPVTGDVNRAILCRGDVCGITSMIKSLFCLQQDWLLKFKHSVALSVWNNIPDASAKFNV